MIQIVRDIQQHKTGKMTDRKDFNEVFVPYMVQRWCSMASDIDVVILNSVVNSLYKTLSNAEMYRLMTVVLPRTGSRGTYIKSKKMKRKPKKENINISHRFEESSKNIDESLEMVFGKKEK